MSGETATNGQDKEKEISGITDPRDTDVLCGRGGAALRHPGNQTYRRLVNLNKGLYITCLKTEKLKISRSIVAAIREQNGRFLEKDASKGSWFDIGDKKAIEKTSQALREGQPKLRQKIVEMGGGAAGTAALMEQQFGANGMYAQGGMPGGGGMQHQNLALQQQAQMRGGYDPTFSQQLGTGGQMGTGMSSMMNPQHQSMASAMRNMQAQQQQQQHHQQQFRQQFQQQNHQNHLHHHQQQRQHQQHQQRMHRDMPPPQARQALHNEMMRLSMHGNEDDPQQPRQDRSMGSSDPAPLRPSLVKRSSAAAGDLVQSNMSLMSDFSGLSGFGNSSHNPGAGGSMFGMGDSSRKGLGPSSHGDPFGSGGGPINPYAGNSGVDDRRQVFAKMKYKRPPSDRLSARQIGLSGASAHSIGDGMPDFHMVESSLSLYSNLSGMTGGERQAAVAADGEKKQAGDFLGAGSRHSIMSGLSRISDTSEVHSIFSDLSRKIGNVSTRSIAMSEISGIDAYRGGEDSDSTPSFGEVEPRQAGTMDFDVF